MPSPIQLDPKNSGSMAPSNFILRRRRLEKIQFYSGHTASDPTGPPGQVFNGLPFTIPEVLVVSIEMGPEEPEITFSV